MNHNLYKVVIVDYDAGNPISIKNMIKKIGYESLISNRIEDIKLASHLILPGVGHFKYGIDQLKKTNLIPVLEDKVINEKTPLLGICLGMQLLTASSEEGDAEGLNWIPSTKTTSLKKSVKSLKIPHMGWNYVQPVDHVLFRGIVDPRFYFVHSYKVESESEAAILAKTTYEVPFISAIQKENILGVQFHPEKSHRYGFQLLKNFVELV